MPNQTRPLIDACDVIYRPAGKTVLSGVTLQSDAQRIGIVGRNGSGKTSFARILAGLDSPDQGQVHVAGVDVANDRKAAIGAIGILFQNPDHQIIFPTVEEELAFGLQQQGDSHDVAAKKVTVMLAEFGKSHWAQAAVHQLSQGQRQLVCLMAVLLMRPQVIVLDEPFSGLDIPTRLHLSRTLNALDVTIVVITHDPSELQSFDHVLWLDHGAVRMQGRPAQVLPEFDKAMQDAGATDDFSDIAC